MNTYNSVQSAAEALDGGELDVMLEIPHKGKVFLTHLARRRVSYGAEPGVDRLTFGLKIACGVERHAVAHMPYEKDGIVTPIEVTPQFIGQVIEQLLDWLWETTQ